MKFFNSSLLIIIIIFFELFFFSCKKPSYPKDQLEQSAKKILKKERNLDCNLKLIAETIYLEIEIPKEELISEEKTYLTKAIKKIESASLTVVRLSLSTDAKIDFIVSIAKVKDFDFCVRIIQRLQDIKDYLYLKISRGNYEKRVILEMLPYSKLEYKNISFEEFLCRLLVSRYNMMIRINPFLSNMLNNITLEFNQLLEKEIVLKSNHYKLSFTESVKQTIKQILIESYIDIFKKYKYFLPTKIKIYDINDYEILSLSVF